MSKRKRIGTNPDPYGVRAMLQQSQRHDHYHDADTISYKSLHTDRTTTIHVELIPDAPHPMTALPDLLIPEPQLYDPEAAEDVETELMNEHKTSAKSQVCKTWKDRLTTVAHFQKQNSQIMNDYIEVQDYMLDLMFE